MCGIFSFFSKNKLTNKDISLCNKGLSLLKHRGPDDKGVWTDLDKGVYIGHQRLSIIDLTKKAKQPMRKHNLVLSYNGEIYNFNELKKYLKKKNIDFFSKSDSEVLLSLWQLKNLECLNDLDGMFAFVIWDGKKGWVARDKFGEKPIYYAYEKRGVFISSELGPLVKVLNKKKIFSKKLTASFFSLGYIPAPYTAYEDIFVLNPASCLKISKGKVDKKIKYFDFTKSLQKIPREKKIDKDFIDKFHQELINSIKSRLYSDAPTCLFLSSGVDSSLIASIISKELKFKIQSITIGLSDQYDETDNARKIAKYLNLPHYVSKFNFKEKTSVNDVINLFQQPNDNLNVVSVKKMSQIAKKKKFKVGITGNGGDELTHGYLFQQFINKYKNIYLIPERLRKLILFFLYPLKNINTKISTYENIFALDNIFLYTALKNNPQISILKIIPGFKEWCFETFKDFNNRNFYEKASFFDLVNVMPNSRLSCFDIGSMSEGIELRSPFLNYKLFKIYQNLDPKFLLNYHPKYLLKEILKRYLPKKLIFDYKKGFVYPLSQFIKENKISNNKLLINKTNFSFKDTNDYSWQKIIIRKKILENFFE